MMAETANKVASSSKNSLGKYWETIWIPYYDVINGAPSISFPSTMIRAKDPQLEAKGISWKNGRSLLQTENFITWDTSGTPSARNCSVNSRFVFNGTT